MEKKEFEQLNKLIYSSFANGAAYVPSWYEAQDYIIKKFEMLFKDSKKKLTTETKNEIKIYQRTIDSILWLYLKREPSDVRKFFGDKQHVFDLRNHNLEKHLDFSKEIKNKFTDIFALISDLGSNINTGDVIAIGPNIPFAIPIEIKSGKVNEMLLASIVSKAEGNSQNYDEFVDSPRFSKQLQRIERQQTELKETMELYVTNESENNRGSRYVIINDYDSEYFDEELSKLVHKANEDGQASILVDDCLLLVGSRIDNEKFDPTKIFSQYIDKDGQNSLVYSTFSIDTREKPQCCPLIALNIGIDEKYLLSNGDIFIMFMFMGEKFCDKYSNESYTLKFVPDIKDAFRLQYHEDDITSLRSGYNLIMFNNEGRTLKAGDGLFNRIFDNLQKPSTVAKVQEILFEEFYQNVSSFKDKAKIKSEKLARKIPQDDDDE